MPLPSPTDPVWDRLAQGSPNRLQTSNLATQLLTKRMERSSDPTPAKAQEIRVFFEKWERALGAEIQQLSSL